MTQTKRDELAIKYSEMQFANAKSFSVIQGACNDEIFEESYLAGFAAALASDEVRGLRKLAISMIDYYAHLMNPRELDQFNESLKAFDKLAMGEM